MKFQSLLVLFALFIFNSCDLSSTYHGTKNTVGNWHHQKSQMMGGYRISADHQLTIIRNGPGDYLYNLKKTVRDEMYVGFPETE